MKKIYALLLLCAGYMAGAQELFPYLQSAKPTSIYVNWKTSENPESMVQFGLQPDALTSAVIGTNNIYNDTGYNNDYYFHSVKLENLQPNTKYYYKIKTGNSVSSVYSFKTVPLPGQAATTDGHLRFLVLGDNQMRNVPRFDTLVSAAKRKIAQKWGTELDPADNIAMTVMVGDQVDVGTLDHYENVHFKKNKQLSGYLPISTLVGNHETYGTLGMNAYYGHYVLDDMTYQGINSGTENYYANQ
ncbi:MAG: metallophosphoesterase, partial [Moraxellaceae bacterium]